MVSGRAGVVPSPWLVAVLSSSRDIGLSLKMLNWFYVSAGSVLSAQRPPRVAFALFGGGKGVKTYVYIDGFNLYYAIKDMGCKWLDPKRMTEQVVPSARIEKVRYFTARVSGAVDAGAPGRQQIFFKALATVPEVQIHLGTFLAKSNWRPVMLLPVAHRALTDTAGSRATFVPGNLVVDVDAGLATSRPERLPVGRYGKGSAGGRPAALPDAVKAQVFTMEEKGSDVNLAVHLVNDAWAGRFDAAVVVSNDTDLVEPIRIVAQELGKSVYLLTPPGKFGAASPLVRVATHQRHIRPSHLRASQFPDPVWGPDGQPIAKPAGW